MSDFLHTLRTQHKDKRFNKNRKINDNNNYKANSQYKNNYNGSSDWNNSDRKRLPEKGNIDVEQLVVMSYEAITAIKDLLGQVIDNQKSSIEVEERRTAAEERKAEALENIALHLNQVFAPQAQPNQEYYPENSSNLAVKQSSDSQLRIVKSDINNENISYEEKRKRDRMAIINIINSMREQGMTYTKIASYLSEQNFPTFSGRGKWHAQTVHRLCRDK